MKALRRIAVLLVAGLLMGGLSVSAEAQLFGRKNDDSSVRIDQLEETIRALNGQIEQMTYQVRELQDQLRRMQEDNEYRFQQLEGGAPAGAAQPSNRSSLETPMDSHGGASDTAALGTPPQTLGTLPDGAGGGDADWSASGGYGTPGAAAGPGTGPMDLGALADGSGDPLALPQDPGTAASGDAIAGLATAGDPRAEYDQAYGLAVAGKYDAAAEAFRSFVALYPDHPLAGNAQFWLGESLLSQRNYRDAADAFLQAYTNYPQSDKRSDSLLKLGMSLNGLGEREAACATYSELLTKFPGAAPAVLQQAQDERRRAQCS